jgi:hypothetical protein
MTMSLCPRTWPDETSLLLSVVVALFFNGRGLVEDSQSYTSWLSKVMIKVNRTFGTELSK